jgi:hypothetical protein
MYVFVGKKDKVNNTVSGFVVEARNMDAEKVMVAVYRRYFHESDYIVMCNPSNHPIVKVIDNGRWLP